MPRQESIRRERGGNRFVRHTGIAAPYMLDNVSTDIPSPALTDLTQGLGRDRGTAQPADPGATAFANVRYLADGSENPDFPFNQEAFRRASIMIVGLNYGTGSSRTGAITRPLAAWGVQVYIGESFGPIFLTNAVQYGVLTVELPRPQLEAVAQWARDNNGVEMTVDLEREIIVMPGAAPISFQTDPRVRTKLMNGMHDLEEIEPHLPEAETKRAEHMRARPWVYQPRGPSD